ncbi:YciI family protein [Nocardioides marinquilinus]|uniref:YciI family protein n=1 Tax=Nocardioides marinquilinus TaxID=1210400 RepID=A0ABP9PED1_9ACTN
MKFLITLAESDPDAWLTATPEEQEQVFAQHRAFDAAVEERGTLVAGAALDATSTARTVRGGPDGRVVTEGPYAETAEQVTGVYLVDLPDLETALDVVRLLPEGYVVEVRPTVALEGY